MGEVEEAAALNSVMLRAAGEEVEKVVAVVETTAAVQ